MKYPISEERCKGCVACMPKISDMTTFICYAGKKNMEKCYELNDNLIKDKEEDHYE